MVLIKVNEETASKYRNGNCYAIQGKKRMPSLFRLEADDYTIEDALNEFKENKNVAVIDYVGNMSKLESLDSSAFESVYIVYKHVLEEVTENDVAEAVHSTPIGVVCMCELPEDFNDMKFVYDMCIKYPSVRFCGGYLFRLEGCRIGYCAKDTLDENINVKSEKYIASGDGCIFQYVDLDTVELELKQPSMKSKKKSSKSIKAPSVAKATKPKSESKKPSMKQVMGNLLGQGGLVDL